MKRDIVHTEDNSFFKGKRARTVGNMDVYEYSKKNIGDRNFLTAAGFHSRLKVLGSGAEGVVVLAVRDSDKKQFAIKMMESGETFYNEFAVYEEMYTNNFSIQKFIVRCYEAHYVTEQIYASILSDIPNDEAAKQWDEFDDLCGGVQKFDANSGFLVLELMDGDVNALQDDFCWNESLVVNFLSFVRNAEHSALDSHFEHNDLHVNNIAFRRDAKNKLKFKLIDLTASSFSSADQEKNSKEWNQLRKEINDKLGASLLECKGYQYKAFLDRGSYGYILSILDKNNPENPCAVVKVYTYPPENASLCDQQEFQTESNILKSLYNSPMQPFIVNFRESIPFRKNVESVSRILGDDAADSLQHTKLEGGLIIMDQYDGSFNLNVPSTLRSAEFIALLARNSALQQKVEQWITNAESAASSCGFRHNDLFLRNICFRTRRTSVMKPEIALVDFGLSTLDALRIGNSSVEWTSLRAQLKDYVQMCLHIPDSVRRFVHDNASVPWFSSIPEELDILKNSFQCICLDQVTNIVTSFFIIMSSANNECGNGNHPIEMFIKDNIAVRMVEKTTQSIYGRATTYFRNPIHIHEYRNDFFDNIITRNIVPNLQIEKLTKDFSNAQNWIDRADALAHYIGFLKEYETLHFLK